MLTFCPRRRPHAVGSDLLSFASLQHWHRWPALVAKQLQQSGLPIGGGDASGRMETSLAALLCQQGVLSREPDPNLEVFALREFQAGRWANSERGRRVAQAWDNDLCVLEGLSFEDIDRLPRSGPFLYLGDGNNGFYAPQSGHRDGKIPCPKCLLLRYLAGRMATPQLYRVLQTGARVAFPLAADDTIPFARLGATESGIAVFGRRPQNVSEALPLPNCPECLDRSSVTELTPGLFSPLLRCCSDGERHLAELPQLLWLAGVETVGGGGSRDASLERGQARARNEAMERYAAHFVPASAGPKGVPFQSQNGSLLHLDPRRALLTEPGSLSTGLACRSRLPAAIADGLREVCERDALARFWLAVQNHTAAVKELGSVQSEGITVELYQLDSYHLPTVLAVGTTSQGRLAVGAACQALESAIEKAIEECLQCAGYFATLQQQPADPPETFSDHALLYWLGHQKFPRLDQNHGHPPLVRPLPAPVYHSDLTPRDLALVGLQAVRVHVPSLLHPPQSHLDWAQMLVEAGWTQGGVPPQPHPFS